MNYARLLAAASLAALTACSGNTVRNTLGLERAPPDEYRVVSRPPLSVPPQFTVRPPDPTAQAPGQIQASTQASYLITGTHPDAPGTPAPHSEGKSSSAESSFLQQVGADKSDPAVRSKLMEERLTVQDKQEEKSWWNPFASDPQPKETIVDAGKETQRIKSDTDAGKPVNEGETAVVKQRDTGVLGRIFGY
jgi:hypothetical protein